MKDPKELKRKQRRRSPRRSKERPHVPRTADDFFSQPEEFQTEYEDTLRVLSRMRSDGLSLRKAAKQEGLNPRTVTELGRQALKKRKNRSYSVTKRDSLLRVLQIPTPEGTREIAIRSSRDASTLGQYWDAVHKYLRTGDASRIEKFCRKTIKDANGQEVPLITDLKELNRLGSAGVLSFESLYARSA